MTRDSAGTALVNNAGHDPVARALERHGFAPVPDLFTCANSFP
jgi:hypothetical protein